MHVVKFYFDNLRQITIRVAHSKVISSLINAYKTLKCREPKKHKCKRFLLTYSTLLCIELENIKSKPAYFILPKMSSSSSETEKLAKWCRKWTYVNGAVCMLVSCGWGLVNNVPGLVKDEKGFTGAHHQWAHAGELMVGAGTLFPFMKLSPLKMKICFWTFMIAMWTNGAAYAVAALSGDYWLASKPHENRPYTIWSSLSLLLVPVLCGPACFISFGLMTEGLLNSDED